MKTSVLLFLLIFNVNLHAKDEKFNNAYMESLKNNGIKLNFKAVDHVSYYDVFRLVEGKKVIIKSGVKLREAMEQVDSPEAEQNIKFELSKIETKVRSPYSISETECISKQMNELFEALNVNPVKNIQMLAQLDSLNINFEMNTNYKATAIKRNEANITLNFSLRNDAIYFTNACDLVKKEVIADLLSKNKTPNQSIIFDSRRSKKDSIDSNTTMPSGSVPQANSVSK